MNHKTYAINVPRVERFTRIGTATWGVLVGVAPAARRDARVRCSRKRDEESDDRETHVVGTVVSARCCFVSFVFRALLIDPGCQTL